MSARRESLDEKKRAERETGLGMIVRPKRCRPGATELCRERHMLQALHHSGTIRRTWKQEAAHYPYFPTRGDMVRLQRNHAPCTAVPQCRRGVEGHHCDIDQLLTTICLGHTLLIVDRVKYWKDTCTSALSMRVFLHCPSGPASEISCIMRASLRV